jgi:hypothetical protein
MKRLTAQWHEQVAEAVPSDAAVNEALRALLRATKVVKRPRRQSNPALHQTGVDRVS